MAENRKEFKFGIEGKDYPKRLLKDLEQHINKISKEHRAIPKSLNDWKKELSFLKYEASDLTTKLEKQQKIVSKLSATFKTLKGKDRQIGQVELDKSQRKMESLQNRMDKQTRMVASVGTYTATQQNAIDKSVSGGRGIMGAFATGGVAGAGGAFLKSGMGKLGMAGLVAYGVAKTYGWVQEKSQPVRDFHLQSLKLSRQANLQFNLDKMLLETDMGKRYKKTPQQMMEMAASLYGTTGAHLLKTPQVLEEFAGFAKKQGLEYGQVSGMLGAGVRAGVVGGEIDVKTYFGTYVKAMEQGVDKGFSKNERIKQLIQLTRTGTKVTGEITKEGFNKLIASWMMLEKFGGVAFKGEKGMRALEMATGVFKPSPTTTPMFAAMSMMGLIPKEFIEPLEAYVTRKPTFATKGKSAVGGLGISKGVYESLLPGEQWTMKQAALYEKGGLPAFRAIYKRRMEERGEYGAPSFMARVAGVEPTSENMVLMAKMLSILPELTPEKYKDMMKTFEDPAKNVAESINGLNVEMSKYLDGTITLKKATIALSTVIGTEISLRKFQLMLANKFNIGKGKIAKASTAEFSVYEQMLTMFPAETQDIIRAESARRASDPHMSVKRALAQGGLTEELPPKFPVPEVKIHITAPEYTIEEGRLHDILTHSSSSWLKVVPSDGVEAP